MKTKLFPVALAGLRRSLAAGCGRENDDDAAAAAAAAPDHRVRRLPPTTGTPPATTAAPAAAAGRVRRQGRRVSELGKIMASADGLTLYGFINDVNAISTCYSTCAEAWPPVIVDDEWAVGPGLDTGIFSTTEREDGSLQLVAGKFPLYTYGGDAAPGDTTGQGSGDVWFAVNLDGTLIADDAAPAASRRGATAARGHRDRRCRPDDDRPRRAGPGRDGAPTALGEVIVDADGMTLYGFTNDADGTPTCEGGCAEAWPPVHRRRRRAPGRPRRRPCSRVVERPDGSSSSRPASGRCTTSPVTRPPATSTARAPAASGSSSTRRRS